MDRGNQGTHELLPAEVPNEGQASFANVYRKMFFDHTCQGEGVLCRLGLALSAQDC